jgi:UDP-N-acetylmuramoylalanine--D-glutamate ligase
MLVEELQGQRIGILGAGREGQAVYHWLKSRLPNRALQLFVETPIDSLFVEQLAPEDTVQVGSLDAAPLSEFDVLLRSPGVSPYRPALQAAEKAGVRILSPSSLWFSAHPDAKTICITGTKGKSTTSALVAHMLRACGAKVQLAGNIGLPLLACDDEDVDWWVIELSSYQLCDLQANPHIGVLLNLSPEHLDWHGGVENYSNDKLKLAELTQKNGLIVNAADSLLRQKFAGDDATNWFNSSPGISQGIRLDGSQFMDGDNILRVEMPANMPGKHNRSNVAAALTVLRKAGYELDRGIASLASYQSLPHRLQVLGERDGVSWINDSIASTPVATAAALEALAGKSIVLLIGGLDRGLDWSCYLEDFLAYTPKAIVAMPDNGPAVIQKLEQLGFECAAGHHVSQGLEDAVEIARHLCSTGDIVLLSPGAPSFPRFIDFQHRGSEFARLAGF